MAFTANKQMVRKLNYVAMVNLSNSTIEEPVANLDKFNQNPKETIYTGSTALSITNASTDVLVLTGTCISATAGATDGKLRMLVNRKSSGNVNIGGKTVGVGKSVFILDDAVTDPTGFHALGICLAEVGFTQERDDDVQLADGNEVVVGSKITVSAILPGAVEQIRNIVASNANVGFLIYTSDTKQGYYIKNLNPFVSIQIKGNTLNQTEITIEKSSMQDIYSWED